MDDRSRVVMAALVGASIGGVMGCLYLTEDGRRLRDEIEPVLDDVVTEIRRWRRTLEKARAASTEAWSAIHDVVGDESSRPAPWEAA